MSTVKISEDLFLGKVELERLQEFLSILGLKKQLLNNSGSFGVVKASSDIGFQNFKVTPGTSDGTFQISIDSYAIDKNGDVIHQRPIDNLPIPDEGEWYWVKIKYSPHSKEKGLVSINTQGVLTGVGTNFLSTLRPQPDFPTKIKFFDGSLNTGEYEVISVTNDTTALLAGNFQTESNLSYGHVGTFTPGHSPTEGEKFPFRFDGCIELTLEGGGLILVSEAEGLIEGEEFYIAKVKNTGGVVEVEDHRTQVWQSIPQHSLTTTPSVTNPVVGIEEVRWYPTNDSHTQEKNLVTVGWGFRSTNYTLNPTSNTVTILGGNGGRLKDTSSFVSGNFNGWLLYTPKGKPIKILTSTKAGSQINIVLDSLTPDDFSVVGLDVERPIVIVPDVEEIQFKTTPGMDEWGSQKPTKTHTFPCRQGYGVLELDMYSNLEVSYNVVFRYGIFRNWSPWGFFETDSVGYLREVSFDSFGNLKSAPDRVFFPTTKVENDYDGWLFLTPSPNSYSRFKERVDNNTKPGTELRVLDVDVNLHNLVVGTSTKTVILQSKVGDLILTQNIFINLDLDGVVDGSEFMIWIKGSTEGFPFLGPFNIRLVQEYQDSSTYTLLKQLNFRDVQYLKSSTDESYGLLFFCSYRVGANKWEVKQLGEFNTSTWTTPSLATNYAALGPPWHLFQARKDPYNNRVFLRGAIQNTVTSIVTDAVVATLPEGFRPIRKVRSSCVVVSGGVLTVRPIEIDPTGTITVFIGHDGTLPLDFTGVNFDLDS